MLNQIVFERLETHGERAIPPGAQAHIDAEHEAIGISVAQQADQPFAQLVEILVIGDGAFAAVFVSAGLALFRIEKNQVDVRRHIEFAAAQLAHADHMQLQCRAGGVKWFAVARFQLAAQSMDAGCDGLLSERGDRLRDFVERRRTCEVALHHREQHVAAQNAHRSAQLFRARKRAGHIGQALHHRRAREPSAPPFQQFFGQIRRCHHALPCVSAEGAAHKIRSLCFQM